MIGFGLGDYGHGARKVHWRLGRRSSGGWIGKQRVRASFFFQAAKGLRQAVLRRERVRMLVAEHLCQYCKRRLVYFLSFSVFPLEVESSRKTVSCTE